MHKEMSEVHNRSHIYAICKTIASYSTFMCRKLQIFRNSE